MSELENQQQIEIFEIDRSRYSRGIFFIFPVNL